MTENMRGQVRSLCTYINTHPELHPVLCILVLNDGSHLQVVLEGAGDVVGSLAGLDTALDTGAHPLLAENTDQRPARWLKYQHCRLTDNWLGQLTLTGMLEIFVIGSIFSTSPMETSGIQRAQLT